MHATQQPFTPTVRPAALEGVSGDVVLELDVRPILRAGGEPFQEIMGAVGRLEPDQVLCLRTTFEPAPLYGVLGRKGFEHWTERLALDDWRIWFFRPPAVLLDVRGLEPPEPMVRTLEAVERLAPGEVLVQINRRVPRFLLPELTARGLSHAVHEAEPELVRLTVRRPAVEMGTVGPAAAPDAAPPPTEAPGERELDVRVIPPPEKHPAIFATFEALAPGESFVLVNDHDPKPLRHQFEAEHAGGFTWRYEAEGPVVWRVRITREGA